MFENNIHKSVEKNIHPYQLFLVLTLWLCQLTVCAQEPVFQKGDEYAFRGDYKNAIQEYEALRHRGKEEKNVAMEMMALFKMSGLAMNLGNTDDAIDYFLSLIPLCKQAGFSYQELLIYLNLQQIFQQRMDMASAKDMSQKADSIARGHNDVRYRMAIIPKLAEEAEHNHNLELAEQYLLEAEKDLKLLKRQDRLSSIPMVYGNLKQFYLRSRQWEKAKRCIDTLVDSYKTYSNDQLLVSRGQLDHVWLGSLMLDEDYAYNSLKTVYEGFTASSKTGPADWIMYYDMKAKADDAFGKKEEACNDLKKVLAIADSTGILSERNYFGTLHNLAYILFRADHPEEAKEAYRRCAEFCKRQYGDNSSEYAKQLFFLANISFSCGDHQQGADYYTLAFNIINDMFATNLKYLSVEDRNYFWQSCYMPIIGMTEYAWHANMTNTPFTRCSYEAHLLEKNLHLQIERSLSHFIYTKQDSSIKSNYSEMEELQQQVKKLSRDFESNKEQIANINRRIHILDQQITDAVSLSGYDSFQKVSYGQIKEALHPGDVLIDFIDIMPSQGKHDYYMYVVRNDQENPELHLCLTDSFLLELIGTDSPPHSVYQKHISTRLTEQIWNPISHYVSEGATLYYVPSGILHMTAIESLSLPDGSLLGDHCHFVRLSSAREVTRLNHTIPIKSEEGQDMVIFGGLTYDMNTDEMQKEAQKYDVPQRFSTRGEDVRGNSPWKEMKGSKAETTAVANIMRKAGTKVEVKSGKQGTEEAFLSLDGQAPSVLLLSTHGFYYTAENAQNQDYLKGYKDGMSLTGLILSGGNTAWCGREVPEGVLSGVLTADKIARMDLHGLDLVVLSACQSGAGFTAAEGFYGLQRAFKKAGAQTVVMTLWDVSDNAAKDFTVEFFQCLTVNGWNKQDAFEQAKKHIREKHTNPYHWAAFVMLD